MDQAAQNTVTELDGLRVDQTKAKLGVHSDHTMAAWAARACPYRHGQPFKPEPITVRKKQKNQWGWIERPYEVLMYSPQLVATVQENMKLAKSGRWIDESGRAWLSLEKAGDRLRQVKKDFFNNTLLIWRRSGCIYFPGSLTAKRFGFLEEWGGKGWWFLEEDIEQIAGEMARAGRGEFGPKDDPCVTVAEAARRYSFSRSTLERHEIRSPFVPGGRLLRVDNPYRCRGGKRRKQSKDGPSDTGYRIADLNAIDRGLKNGNGFDGVYRNGDTKAFSLKKAAKISGLSIATLRRADDLPKACLVQPKRGGHPEAVVMETDLSKFVLTWPGSIVSRIPHGYRDSKRIAKEFGLNKPGERIGLGLLLKDLHLQGKLPARRIRRHVRSMRRWADIVFYDCRVFRRWLGLRNIQAVISEVLREETKQSNRRRAAERAALVVDDHIAGTDGSPRVVQQPARRGRKKSVLTLSIEDFCLAEKTKGKVSKLIAREVRERFRLDHFTDADVRIHVFRAKKRAKT